MFRLVDCLVDSDIVNFHVRRKIVAVARRKRAGAGWVATFKAFALAIFRARSGKSPRRRHGDVHEQVHGFARDLGSHDVQTGATDPENQFTIRVPFYVASRSVFRGGLPFNAINMLVGIVSFVKLQIARDCVSLIRQILSRMYKRNAVEKGIQVRSILQRIFQVLVPVPLRK